jgi:hypothetical protein
MDFDGHDACEHGRSNRLAGWASAISNSGGRLRLHAGKFLHEALAANY